MILFKKIKVTLRSRKCLQLDKSDDHHKISPSWNRTNYVSNIFFMVQGVHYVVLIVFWGLVEEILRSSWFFKWNHIISNAVINLSDHSL